MNFVSTRSDNAADLAEALQRGIAPDGGLYLPEHLPSFSVDDFDQADTVQEVATVLLRPFFAGSSLSSDLAAIVAETYSFPVPHTLLPVEVGKAALLELFHGPTSAFKDVGAGFLAACLCRLRRSGDRTLTILVATSGDTGGAVAAAFDGREGIRVAVLFPEGRVSDRQAQQLSGWSDNVLSLSVRGSFDDCQAMVKAAMGDEDLRRRYRFSSANSINVGRLLPQCTYYAHSSLQWFRQTGRKPGYIVPTGNLGNALACLLARAMGLPIGEVILATNENRIISDFLDGQEWLPRDSIATLASAMDVGNPSNMERVRKLFGEADALSGQFHASPVSDTEIERQIRLNFREWGITTCPHTATATHVYRALDATRRTDSDWILVATAHAAKFEQIVEPLIERSVPVPPALAAILSRPGRAVSIESGLRSLAAALAEGFAS